MSSGMEKKQKKKNRRARDVELISSACTLCKNRRVEVYYAEIERVREARDNDDDFK